MKKSEQAGLVAYPIKNVKIHKGYSGDFVDYDKNADKRKIFVEGYEKAEKDYKDILDLCNDVVSEYKNGSLGDSTIEELQRLMMTIRS